jgi:molybdate transport system regulatory protein
MKLEVRSKCWVEADGELALSDWRVDLLEAIDELGSLAAAAERFDVAYRVAWGKIKQIEGRLGYALLEGHSGGAGGGGTHLTPAGRDLVMRYNRFRTGLAELIEQRFSEEFDLRPLSWTRN